LRYDIAKSIPSGRTTIACALLEFRDCEARGFVAQIDYYCCTYCIDHYHDGYYLRQTSLRLLVLYKPSTAKKLQVLHHRSTVIVVHTRICYFQRRVKVATNEGQRSLPTTRQSTTSTSKRRLLPTNDSHCQRRTWQILTARRPIIRDTQILLVLCLKLIDCEA
jgi:hypothetical protein